MKREFKIENNYANRSAIATGFDVVTIDEKGNTIARSETFTSFREAIANAHALADKQENNGTSCDCISCQICRT